MFLHEDGTGGFLHLQYRLMMNDLMIHAPRDVTNNDIHAVLQKEVSMCLVGGALDTEVSTNTNPFRSFVLILGSLGLL